MSPESHTTRALPRIETKRLDAIELDFEISLFEAYLQFRPHSVEALFGLGNAYTRRGDYAKGLDLDLKLVRLEPDNPTFNYNLACSYSLLNDVDRSLASLKRAVDLGFDDNQQLQTDPDLSNVRRDPRFQKLLVRSRKTR
jgi:tetratricopeptide (TPR) repeat protein